MLLKLSGKKDCNFLGKSQSTESTFVKTAEHNTHTDPGVVGLGAILVMRA